MKGFYRFISASLIMGFITILTACGGGSGSGSGTQASNNSSSNNFNALNFSWQSADGGLANGINYEGSKDGVNSTMAVFGNKLYTAWNEWNGTVNEIRVKAYDGTNWTWADGGGLNGINDDATMNAVNPEMVVFNNELYAAWYELNGNNYVIRVKAYNGSTWTSVDGGGAGGINYDSTKQALYPHMAVLNGTLYVAWSEWNTTAYQMRVKAYDGTNWTWANSGGSNGINYDSSKNAEYFQMAVFNGSLYVAWQEGNGTTWEVRVKAYDGANWTWEDGGGANGINYNPSENAVAPFLTVYNGMLYAAWDEWNGTANELRVKAYDGTNWTWADGGGASGINYKASDNVGWPYITAYNGKLFATWKEWNGTADEIRTRAFDGANWSWADGGGTSGINFNSSENAAYPHLAVFNNALYATWYEWNGTNKEIRVKAGQ